MDHIWAGKEGAKMQMRMSSEWRENESYSLICGGLQRTKGKKLRTEYEQHYLQGVLNAFWALQGL
jgi:hypothetical protein